MPHSEYLFAPSGGIIIPAARALSRVRCPSVRKQTIFAYPDKDVRYWR